MFRRAYTCGRVDELNTEKLIEYNTSSGILGNEGSELYREFTSYRDIKPMRALTMFRITLWNNSDVFELVY